MHFLKQELSLIFFLSLIAQAHAASFDCAAASSNVEQMICASSDLSRLDDRLTARYKQALNASNDIPGLRRSQRVWLANQRNTCSDSACVKAAYKKRINELNLFGLVSDSKGLVICKEVVKLANSGKLKNRLVSFSPPSSQDYQRYEQDKERHKQTDPDSLNELTHIDLYHEGRKRLIGRITSGGTCASSSIVDLTAFEESDPDESGSIPRDPGEDDDDYRWAGWGRRDELVVIRGEPVVLAANFYSHPADIALVSSLRDGGPLCVLSGGEPIRVAITSSRNPALCNAVSRGTIKPTSWNRDDTSQDSPTKLPYQIVDIDDDGTSEVIAIDGYDSGGGCGSSVRWLTQLTKDKGAKADTPLTTLLSKLTGPLYPESDDDIKIFQFRGKHYILAKGNGAALAVYSVWHSALRTWCELEQYPTYYLGKSYVNHNPP